MTYFTFPRPHVLVAGASLILLAACGGGGGGGNAPDTTPPLPAPGDFALATGALTAQNLSDGTVATLTGNVDTSSGAFTVGDLSGTVNDGFSVGTISTGGGFTLAPDGTEFAARYDANPQGGARAIGIIGAASPTGTLPDATAVYTGSSTVTIVDGINIYDLSGDATLTATFGAGAPTVTTALSNLNGVQTTITGTVSDVTDVAEITISGSEIDGNGFGGGTAALTSDSVTALSSDASTTLLGGFYGPNGEEIGGVGNISDTADITFDVLGRR